MAPCHGQRAPRAPIGTGLILALIACSENPTDPAREHLESFHVETPSLVQAGEVFTVKITAIGSAGTRPFVFDGRVALECPRGIITPSTVEVTDGTGCHFPTRKPIPLLRRRTPPFYLVSAPSPPSSSGNQTTGDRQ